MRLSIVDLAQVPREGGPEQALRNMVDLARHVESLGFERFWLAEHHGTRGLASHAPEILIGHVAGATERIRVGSGTVLLNHYSPYKVAEVFRTLHTLYPGRIDLGVGRAFTGPITDVALMRHRDRRIQNADDYPSQVAELIEWSNQSFPSDHPFHQVPILPDVAGAPQVWLLGSSDSSPVLAAQFGLPYAFAGFINPNLAEWALTAYRTRFQALVTGSSLSAPHAILAVNVVCAPTDAEAQWLAMPIHAVRARLSKGNIGETLPTPDEAVRELGALIALSKDPWPRSVVGSPERVGEILKRLMAASGADELMIQDLITDHGARKRSYALVAEALGRPAAKAD